MHKVLAGSLLWIGPLGFWGGTPEVLKSPPRPELDPDQVLQKAAQDLRSRPMLEPEVRKIAEEILRKAEERVREADERVRRVDERMRRFDEQQRQKQNQTPPVKPMADKKP